MWTRSGCDPRLRYHRDMTQTRQSERDQVELSRREREARKEIRVIGDPVLHERALQVNTFDRGLRKLAKRMIRIMHDAPGVGLAAPQIGVLQRLLVYDVDDDPRVPVSYTHLTLPTIYSV